MSNSAPWRPRSSSVAYQASSVSCRMDSAVPNSPFFRNSRRAAWAVPGALKPKQVNALRGFFLSAQGVSAPPSQRHPCRRPTPARALRSQSSRRATLPRPRATAPPLALRPQPRAADGGEEVLGRVQCVKQDHIELRGDFRRAQVGVEYAPLRGHLFGIGDDLPAPRADGLDEQR